ncbi:MAG: IS1634 family transposase, partial [Phycisphaerales bacterium]|nr:IS1634 family transposase [Phycisphaerales bacterium]
MYLKGHKVINKQGLTDTYYKLVNSYRTIGANAKETVRQVVVCTIGKLDQLTTPLLRKQLVARIESLLQKNTTSLFPEPVNPIIDKIAFEVVEKIRLNKFVDASQSSPTPDNSTLQAVHEQQPSKNPSVDLKANTTETTTDNLVAHIDSLEHEEAKEIGAEWLCKQAVEELQLPDKLTELGWSAKEREIALLHLITRTIFPYSENKMASWIDINSGIQELFTGLPRTITRDHLYKNARELFKIKDQLEQHLSHRTNNLFNLQDKIILYDLTNSYFEGRKEGSIVAQFGRSKEKRKDCKLATLALVVNAEGFIKHSQIYEGNIAECKTLEATIESLGKVISPTTKNPIIVMDAAFATKENLALVKTKGYHYLCVHRGNLKDYTVNSKDKKWVEDNNGNKIELSFVNVPTNTDTYLCVHSAEKEKKEDAMLKQACERLENQLSRLALSIQKPKATKTPSKVYARLGRIQEQYKQIYNLYTVTVEDSTTTKTPPENNNSTDTTTVPTVENKQSKKEAPQKILITNITWKKKEENIACGTYFLRTSIPASELIAEDKMWNIYNTIREVEASFRILKTDLSLRPIYHVQDLSCKAHLFLGVLAYTVVATIRYKLKQKNIHYDWRNVVRIMNTQKIVTSSVKNTKNQIVFFKQSTRPIPEVQEIYAATNYKSTPKRTKLSCSP